MQIEKNKIRFTFYIGSIAAIVISSALLSLIYTQSLNKEYDRKIEQLTSSIVNEKKSFLRNAVERTIQLIESEREQAKHESNFTSLTDNQIENKTKDRIGKLIRDLRLIDDGYIWVNHIVNYAGGDDYAIRQIHPNLPDTEGMMLSTNTLDSQGNRPYEAELNGINENGELYFEYYFKKMNSDNISHKMSFAKLYKPYDWVIATGVYLDDIDKLIEVETVKMKKTHKDQMIYSFFVALLVLIFSIAVLVLLERHISRLILSYEQGIKEQNDILIKAKEKTEKALAEIKTIKGIIPICMHCKEIRDDKGAWNKLESYIMEHSDAQFSHGVCAKCMKEKYGVLPAKEANGSQNRPEGES